MVNFSMKLIKTHAITEFTEKKSKFIGYAFHVESEEEIEEIISELWKEHRKATHICTAYVLGLAQPRGNFDDDGEPSLTAGYPMLQVLEGQDYRQVLLCSVRYYGGIQLGKGGLIRAYTRSAQETLEAAGYKIIKAVGKWKMTYAYHHHGPIEYLLSTEGVLGPEADYTDVVTRVVYLEDEGILSKLMEQSSGQIEIEKLVDCFLDTYQGLTELYD